MTDTAVPASPTAPAAAAAASTPPAERGRPHAPEPLWREMVGEVLREQRTDRDETLVETSRRAGISPQYLSEIERGMKEPSSEMLAAVAGALGLTLLDLTLGVADRMAPAPMPAAATVRAAYALAA